MASEFSSEFFVSGGTVPLGAASYVTRDADRALLAALRAGRYCYVLTSRQMGKSSLSVRTMEALRAEGVRTAFVDLTRVGGRNVTAEQWYAGLLGEIGRGLGDRAGMMAYWKAHPEAGPMQRFFGALREVVSSEAPSNDALSTPNPLLSQAKEGGSLVIFIDEIDATRSLPFSTDEFFAGIRECYNRRVSDPAMERLSFCLIGVAIPSDLMGDAKLTPFNIGERIVLTDFTPAEAMGLAAGLGKGGAATIERIVHWTDGHPFLTQSLCRRLSEQTPTHPPEEERQSTSDDAFLRSSSRRTLSPKGEGSVDRIVAAELFEARARETNINLADVGNRVLNSYDDPDGVAKYRADVLSLYERIVKGKRVADDESNRLVAVLKLAGLVKAEGGFLRVRNRIYERVFGLDWIREHMPNQELRRQKTAFRVGAIRTAAIAAAVLAVVSSLAMSAMRNAREAKAALAKAKASEARALTAEGQAKEFAAARTVALGEATTARAKAMSLAEERKAALDRAKVAETRALAESRLTREQSIRADAAARRALASAETARDQGSRADREASSARTAAALAERESGRAYASAMVAASSMLEPAQPEAAAPLLASLRSARDKWKGWELDHLTAAVAGRPLVTVDPKPVEMPPRAGGVSALALSADGRYAVTGGVDGTLAISDAKTGQSLAAIAAFPVGVAVRALATFGDAVVAVGDKGRVRAFNVADGRPRWSTGILGTDLRAVATSPDGRSLLVAGTTGGAALLDVDSGRVVQSSLMGNLGAEEFVAVAFVAKGNFITLGSTAGHVIVAGRDFTSRNGFQAKGPITGLAWSPSGTQIAASGAFGIEVWDAATLGEVLSDPQVPLAGVAASPDGSSWIGVSDSGKCLFWDPKSGERKEAADISRGAGLTTLALTVAGDGLLSSDGKGRAALWALRRPPSPGIERVAVEPNEINAVAASADGRWIAHSVPFVDRNTQKRMARIVVTDAQGRLRRTITTECLAMSMAFSPDGRVVAANGGTVEAYDVLTGERLYRRTGDLAGLAFSRSGRLLAYAEPSGLGIADTRTWRPLRHLPGSEVRSCRFSKDGTLVVYGDEAGEIVLSDPSGARTRPPLLGHLRGVWNLEFSADGKRLLSCGPDAFRMWDVPKGREIGQFHVPGGTSEVALFSHDERRIFTQSQGPVKSSTRVWDARTLEPLMALGGEGGGRALCLLPNGDPLAGYTDGEVRHYVGFSKADYADLDRRRRLAASRAEKLAIETSAAAEARRQAVERYQRTLEMKNRLGSLVVEANGKIADRQWEAALKSLDAMAIREPDYLDGRDLRGLALARLGRFAEAEREFRYEHDHSPSDVRLTPLYPLIMSVLAQGMARNAGPLIDEILALPKLGSDAATFRLFVPLSSGGFVLSPKQRAKFEKAVLASSPDNINLPISQYRIGRYTEAIRSGEAMRSKANAADQNLVVGSFGILLSEAKLGRMDEARAEWDRLAPTLRRIDEAYAKRDANMESWTFMVVVHRLRAEAEALLASSPYAPKATGKGASPSPVLGTLGSLVGLSLVGRRLFL